MQPHRGDQPGAVAGELRFRFQEVRAGYVRRPHQLGHCRAAVCEHPSPGTALPVPPALLRPQPADVRRRRRSVRRPDRPAAVADPPEHLHRLPERQSPPLAVTAPQPGSSLGCSCRRSGRGTVPGGSAEHPAELGEVAGGTEGIRRSQSSG